MGHDTLNKEKIMTKNEIILNKIKEWLEDNYEEQSLSYELRQESARLRDKIEEWENE